MFKPEMLRVYRRLIVLAVLVTCLAVISTTPGGQATRVAEASTVECCGNDNPFVQCADCGDAIRSCRLSCGGTYYSNYCLWEFYCDPADPSNYTCVCRPPEGDGLCEVNYC